MKTTKDFKTPDGRAWRWTMTGWQAVAVFTAQIMAGVLILAAAFILAGAFSPAGM